MVIASITSVGIKVNIILLLFKFGLAGGCWTSISSFGTSYCILVFRMNFGYSYTVLCCINSLVLNPFTLTLLSLEVYKHPFFRKKLYPTTEKKSKLLNLQLFVIFCP